MSGSISLHVIDFFTCCDADVRRSSSLYVTIVCVRQERERERESERLRVSDLGVSTLAWRALSHASL